MLTLSFVATLQFQVITTASFMVLEDWINKKIYVSVMFISMQILNLEEVSQMEFISNSVNVSFPKV